MSNTQVERTQALRNTFAKGNGTRLRPELQPTTGEAFVLDGKVLILNGDTTEDAGDYFEFIDRIRQHTR